VLVSFTDLLRDTDRSAVGAFTCYDLETAAAVLETAGARANGVILLIGGRTFGEPQGSLLLAALVAAAARSDTRACVQLDHCDDLAMIERALEHGAGAVLADGSARSFPDNVAFVRAAAGLAHARGAGVECELGGIAGDEDVARAVAAGALTDPTQASELVQESGADCLAVSIGNVHGVYRDSPTLDWKLLAAIRSAVDLPLSLHGASGIPDAMLRRAIGAGIAKVNVNTELRQAYLSATAETLAAVLPAAHVAALHAAQTAAITRVVERKLQIFEREAIE
jgi:tagatose 1,6-diphosphate aldolase GatY/KbaY